MNKVMLIGNVGYTLQNGTQVPDHTDWHNVILWRKLAEVVEKFVHKGDKLYIEGRIRYTTYDDKQGQRRFVTEIWADNMEMLTPKATAPTSVPQQDDAAAQPQDIAAEAPDGALPF